MKQLNFKKLKSLLPKNPGILGKSEYFNSAVLVPIVKRNGEYNLLFEKRSAHIRQGSEICFPGGEYSPETDDSLEKTAIRETIEELRLKEDQIKIIGNLDIMVGSMGVTIDPFVAELLIDAPDELDFDKNEVEKVFTIPIDFFVNNEPEEYFLRTEVHPFYTNEEGEKVHLFPVEELNLPPKYLSPWSFKKHKVYAWRTSEGTIWGMTAVLIRETIRLIKQTL